jgi:hypothetical protein
MQIQITMKANGPAEVTNRPSAAAPANERKEEPQYGFEDWRYMKASLILCLSARVISRTPEKWPRLVTEEFQRWGIALRS